MRSSNVQAPTSRIGRIPKEHRSAPLAPRRGERAGAHPRRRQLRGAEAGQHPGISPADLLLGGVAAVGGPHRQDSDKGLPVAENLQRSFAQLPGHEPARAGDAQAAVGFDGSDNQAQFIHMGCQGGQRAVCGAGQAHEQVAGGILLAAIAESRHFLPDDGGDRLFGPGRGGQQEIAKQDQGRVVPGRGIIHTAAHSQFSVTIRSRSTTGRTLR